jgi:hypothetical protein
MPTVAEYFLIELNCTEANHGEWPTSGYGGNNWTTGMSSVPVSAATVNHQPTSPSSAYDDAMRALRHEKMDRIDARRVRRKVVRCATFAASRHIMEVP